MADGKKLDPTALTSDDAATMLSKVFGQKISPDNIRTDIDSGAPTNANGTVNLVHYAAWLLGEMKRGS